MRDLQLKEKVKAKETIKEIVSLLQSVKENAKSNAKEKWTYLCYVYRVSKRSFNNYKDYCIY